MRGISSGIWGAALLWLSLMPQARAETADELAAACEPIAQAKTDGSTISYAHTYETGECWAAFATIQELSRWVNQSNRRILGPCTPPKSKRSQLIKVFTDYVERHPGRGSDNFVDVAVDALKEAYPCN